MGYTIGMPSIKLSNVAGKGGKHCGNFAKVAKEALKERQGLDLDINHELSNQNIYEGFVTAEELIDYSNKHIDEINQWRAEHGTRPCDRRKLKKDTVVMCATIIKPPAAMMAQLTHEQRIQLLKDSVEIFKSMVGDQNVKSIAIHLDERVEHAHIFWEPIVDEHRICAKEMHNIKFFRKLNSEMPKQLRAKGWGMIDDCKMYDKDEEDNKREELGDEKYREYRKQQRADRGRTSREFKHDVEEKIAKLKSEQAIIQQDIEQARIQRELAEERRQEAEAQADAAMLDAQAEEYFQEQAAIERQKEEQALSAARREKERIICQSIPEPSANNDRKLRKWRKENLTALNIADVRAEQEQREEKITADEKLIKEQLQEAEKILNDVKNQRDDIEKQKKLLDAREDKLTEKEINLNDLIDSEVSIRTARKLACTQLVINRNEKLERAVTNSPRNIRTDFEIERAVQSFKGRG